MFKTLEHANFGNIFIGNIKTMYNNLEFTVMNNGNSCKFFTIQRGIRQGCPLSAYLFITALETIINKIRNDKNVKGIKVDKKKNTKNRFAS